MFAKPIVFALLAACGVNSGTETRQGSPPPFEKAPFVASDQSAELPDGPTQDAQEDQHFCCVDVDPKAMTGEGCNAISGALETINACANLLDCEGNYTKKDGKVTCE